MFNWLKRFLGVLFETETFVIICAGAAFGGWAQYETNPLWWVWLSSIALFMFFQTSYTWRVDFKDDNPFLLFVVCIVTYFAAPYVVLGWIVFGILRMLWNRRKKRK